MADKKPPAKKKQAKRVAKKKDVIAKPRITLQDMKDMEFASLFIAGSEDIRGNATRCYRYMHPIAKWNTCQVEGSKTLKKPMVQKFLEQQVKIVTEATAVTAEWVLRESINMYDQAVARLPVVSEIISVNEETGETVVSRVEQLVSNPQAALKALELIGKNIVVKAFQENVAVDHTFHLEELLNQRTKAVEAAAARRRAELKVVASA